MKTTLERPSYRRISEEEKNQVRKYKEAKDEARELMEEFVMEHGEELKTIMQDAKQLNKKLEGLENKLDNDEHSYWFRCAKENFYSKLMDMEDVSMEIVDEAFGYTEWLEEKFGAKRILKLLEMQELAKDIKEGKLKDFDYILTA